jgi:two-component system, NtrC family, sensor histidine kinase HydH
MKWQRWIALSGFVLALAALAAWQWDEYGHECDLARETVSSTADSVMNALVGGVRSHRRLGQLFSENIQGVLEGLVRSKDVRAVALSSEDGKSALAAGEVTLLDLKPPFASGECWEAAGFRLVKTFSLPLETAGPGGGRGGGFGGGRGWGGRWQTREEDASGSFVPGKTVAAVLLIDRGRADQVCRRAAWLRSSIVIAGSLVVLCVAIVWRSTVRLAESRGRERSLAMEARHFRDLSQAAAGLAHETRNPLGLIRGWTQRMADAGVDSHDGRQQAQAIIEECDRVTARINQFLAFARPSEPKLERFDPAEVAGELAVLLDPDLIAKRLTLRRMAPGTTIRADREMFRQALFNLLQNAIQFSPEGAAVEVTITRGGRGLPRIEVADHGSGVADEVVDKLFTPYFTTRAGGTGLGLAIVRRIAAAHGWEVGYTPRGGGAVFWLDGIHG